MESTTTETEAPMKKPYTLPTITEHGTVMEITQGASGAFPDVSELGSGGV